MADLSTLDGIADARNELYRRLEHGGITEARAAAQERLLRGQESLKATSAPPADRDGETEGHECGALCRPLAKALLKFTTGTPALTDGTSHWRPALCGVR
jgi:hypothetical protein